MSSSNAEHQYMENVTNALQSIKCIVLTWLSLQMGDGHLQYSMIESLKSMLAHLRTNDDEIASDSGVDKDGSYFNHRSLSQDDGKSETLDNDNVCQMHVPFSCFYVR